MKSFNISIKIKTLSAFNNLNLLISIYFISPFRMIFFIKLNLIRIYLIFIAIILYYFNRHCMLIYFIWYRRDWYFFTCIMEFFNQREKGFGCTGIKYLELLMIKHYMIYLLKSNSPL